MRVDSAVVGISFAYRLLDASTSASTHWHYWLGAGTKKQGGGWWVCSEVQQDEQGQQDDSWGRPAKGFQGGITPSVCLTAVGTKSVK